MEAKIDQTVSIKNKTLSFLAHTTNKLTQWRCQSFWTKEPETIRWIDAFQSHDFFVDIGANIGLYSLYAFLSSKVGVVAFEPEALNYACLNKNIHLNKLDEAIKAYPIAISDKHMLSDLHIHTFEEGASCNNFQERVNDHHLPFQPCYSQGCLSISLDELIEKKFIPIPKHIKIDVDGIEDKIIHGANQLLTHPELHSVLIELNISLQAHRDVINIMKSKGFIFSEKQAVSSIPREGPFEGIGNIIFYRESKFPKIF